MRAKNLDMGLLPKPQNALAPPEGEIGERGKLEFHVPRSSWVISVNSFNGIEFVFRGKRSTRNYAYLPPLREYQSSAIKTIKEIVPNYVIAYYNRHIASILDLPDVI